MATPATATPALDSPPRLRWFDKFILLVALAIGVALFVTVGWMALAPRDPHGAVSLVTATSPLAVILQATLLVAVAAVVATVMIGTKLPDVGVFAAALGLALASLQGNTSAYLLISVAGGDRGAERALAGKLAIESVVWFLLIVVAIAVSGAVMRWCLGWLIAAVNLPRTPARAIEEIPWRAWPPASAPVSLAWPPNRSRRIRPARRCSTG
jgi:hypothetical protein